MPDVYVQLARSEMHLRTPDTSLRYPDLPRRGGAVSSLALGVAGLVEAVLP